MKTVFDLLYPPRCPVCDGVRFSDEPVCCPPCREKLRFIDGPACLCCGRPVGSEDTEYCYDCAKRKRSYSGGLSLGVYEGALKDSVLRFKFSGREEYAGFYADCFTERFGKRLPVTLHVAGKHMVQNALAALTVAHLLHVPDEAALAALKSFQPGAGRSDIIHTDRFTIIDGSYNCNPTSMEAALDVLKTAAGRKVCIFGDMLELGENAPAYHARIGTYAKQLGIDRMLTVGTLAKNAASGKSAGSIGVNEARYSSTRESGIRYRSPVRTSV